MKQSLVFVFLLNCVYIYHVRSANLPGPLVYVVTPSSKSQRVDMGRAAPFYYSNWVKRMDTLSSSTTSTTEKTPDLIFAEFDSDSAKMKSIRNLLEKEKIEFKATTTTTSLPIYVPDDVSDTEISELDHNSHQTTTEKPKTVDMTDYFALYNNLYNTGPVHAPNAPTTSTPLLPTSSPVTIPTTTHVAMENVKDIWHIIDNQKHNQYSNKWEEVPISFDENKDDDIIDNKHEGINDNANENRDQNHDEIDVNFALPGFGTNPGNGGENESRAIRTESNIRFPYVNLKPFMMKNLNTKKVNNMFNLDSFTEIKNPVRGEVQDNAMVPIRQPIDRYNPAQPYLPGYGTKTKQTSSVSFATVAPASVAPVPPARRNPERTVANLVPPPPPPILSDDDFPTPSTYESFPPYPPNGPGIAGPMFSIPSSNSNSVSSNTDDDGPPSDSTTGLGYRYKTPALNMPPAAAAPAPSNHFVPTIPPMSKPFKGYSYDKPSMTQEDTPPPAPDMEDKPAFQGYHYSKPISALQPPEEYPSPSYGHQEAPPLGYRPEHDYPELIFDKPHGSMGDIKGGEGMKGNDVGMMPPPPPGADDDKPDAYGPPMKDHGFPHDFPGDFKYAHDFDDHDYHHHHHHTTTTTTTEMPRVNRYSYYYLGKKLYYLPLYFSVYFVIYVGALIIKAVLRHKITYPNSFRPNDQTASFFSKRSIESHLSHENLHEITGRVTEAIATAANKYLGGKGKDQ